MASTKIIVPQTTTPVPQSQNPPLMPNATAEIWTDYQPDIQIQPNGATGTQIIFTSTGPSDSTQYYSAPGTTVQTAVGAPPNQVAKIQTDYQVDVFINTNPTDPTRLVISIVPTGGGGSPTGYTQISYTGNATIFVPSGCACCDDIQAKIKKLTKDIKNCCSSKSLSASMQKQCKAILADMKSLQKAVNKCCPSSSTTSSFVSPSAPVTTVAVKKKASKPAAKKAAKKPAKKSGKKSGKK